MADENDEKDTRRIEDGSQEASGGDQFELVAPGSPVPSEEPASGGASASSEADAPTAVDAEADAPTGAEAKAESETGEQQGGEQRTAGDIPTDEADAPAVEATSATQAASATETDASTDVSSTTDATPTDTPTHAVEATPADEETAPAETTDGPPTAVSLGLLAEDFVSRVSTALHFYAPAIAPLPALPGRDDDFDDDDAERSSSSRRRNRRRSSSDTRDDESSGSQRTRQQRAPEPITEPQRIKGSTRLEAKKQRRRDGREAGRRRTVVTEAEFLARREAVDRVMVVRSKNGRIQIGVQEDDVLVEHYVARSQDASLIGNVYLGRVQNVLPSMEAAFVDIGRGRNAVLYSGEVDWDAVETGNQPRRIELALKSGERVLVQVTKDPVGHKGARLTSQVSLPGRYLVYVPGGAMNGISRKLPDTERARLKKILKEVLPESSGVIVRTAAEGATEEQLTRDVQRLTSQWEHIGRQMESVQAPALLHAEPDLLVKIVRDVFNEDFSKMLIQGAEAQETITQYLRGVAPDLLERVESYEGEGDPFDAFRITEQIEKALDRKVWLPSGGSLVIDRTEAMTVIDVNTGKFVGSGGNLEETVTKNNLEAAEEIVRQLRLRDIGGIIVVDFIDMVLESNRDLVLRRLVECLSRDRTKHQVAEVTSLGLVQMTRKKLGLGLLETFSEQCDVCAGRGIIVHHDPVVKHRSSGAGGGGGGRRQRGGGASAQQQQQSANGGAHVITEGVKSALAQIAASTIGVPADEVSVEATVQSEQSRPSEQTVDEGSAPASLDEIALPSASADAPAEADRPRKRRKRGGDSRREEAKTEKDQLLDSVLQALPEPKAPGQGRAARRRVSTGVLTGTPVAMPSSDD